MQDHKSALRELRHLCKLVHKNMHPGELEANQWWGEVEPQMVALLDSIANQADKAAACATVFTDEIAEAIRRVRDRLETRR